MRLAFGLFASLIALSNLSLAEEPNATEEAAEPASEAVSEPIIAPRPAQAERSELDSNALRRATLVREQQQLEGHKESFLALYKPANTGQPKGAIIILPGNFQHAETPAIVAPLRHKLPDAGWHTITLSLPDPFDDLPERPAASVSTPINQDDNTDENPSADTEAQEETDSAREETETETTEEIIDTELPIANEEALRAQAEALRAEREAIYVERVFSRIDAALALAQQQQAQRLVLLGQGSGGYWASRYLSERKGATAHGLLLLSPELPSGFGPELDELSPALQVPVGDFHFKDRAAEAEAARQRQNASKRLNAQHYRSIGLQGLTSDPSAEQEQVYRRVRGWLTQQYEKSVR